MATREEGVATRERGHELDGTGMATREEGVATRERGHELEGRGMATREERRGHQGKGV